MALKTNFTDDILSESMNGKRQYNVTENSNGTKSLEDVTDYQSVGSTFSAKDMNETNAAVNQAYDDMGDEFNPEVDYAVGDYTIRNNKIWKFTTAHPAGAWDESHVKATKILSEAHELTENITFPDGTGFYPDEQDGVRGYNTDPGRGADTFVPFKKSPILIGSRSGNGTINCTSINGYEKLSANDFLISITKYNTSVTGGGNMPSGKSFSVIPNKSYNPSTGILTLSGCAWSIYDNPATMATTLTVDIYLK